MSLTKQSRHTPPHLDKGTVEFMARLFPAQCPDPDDSEREIWMKAGEARAALHMTNLLDKQERNFRL